MNDIRWFAPNRYCTLPVAALRASGLDIALDGVAPARLAIAADGQCAVAAYEYARRHHCPHLLYLWDLPPWRLGGGKPDPVFDLGGRIGRIPRVWGRYPERSGYYSRLRFVAKRAIQVWSPSENTARDVRSRFGIDAERVPFCYDSNRFNPGSGEREAGSGGAPVILSISRLVPHKNHGVILRAAVRLDPRPRVRIIGEGPEAGRLRRLAAELGVRLDLTGTWSSDPEVDVAYREASVVVAPSHFEGFGLTPIEGLAMGVPVVVSDIATHREFLGNAVRFFPPDDDAVLAREIAGALGDAASLAASRPPVRPSARPPVPTVLSDLTIEACAARFLPRLERLLGTRA